MDAKEKWYDEEHKSRAFHMREIATGMMTGTNDPVSLRIACSTGQYVAITETGGAIDPLRNYDAMNTDQILERCVMRNVRGYMDLTRDEQIKALRALDAKADAKADKPARKADKGVVNAT